MRKTNYKLLIPALSIGALLTGGGAKIALVAAKGAYSTPPIIQKLNDRISQDADDNDPAEQEKIEQEPTQTLPENQDGDNENAD